MKSTNIPVKNPFPILDYISPEYFCDREAETGKIISALKNGRNITLLSIRRMGKTGLIKNVFHQLKRQKNLKLIYLDILKTESLNDFIRIFANELLKNENKSFLKKLSKLVAGIKGKIVFDEITGMPEIEIDYHSDHKESEKSLDKIFEYLAEQKEKYYIAIDEFQQIINYPEKNTEAILRTYIQAQHKDYFIFSGSSKHILVSMFNDYGRPLYQSSDILNLERLDTEIYSNFIYKHFNSYNISISKELILEYLNKLDIYTFYVQFFFNRLFSTGEKTITSELAQKTLNDIIKEKEYVYINYRNILSKMQYSVLMAIAKENGVSKPNSSYFLRKYNFIQPSSVNKAIKALHDKEMIYKENNKIKVYDVFLSMWLKEY